jgi:ribosomal-protein-alanine N-acetyltransferase
VSGNPANTLVRPGSPGDERRLLQIDASANSSAGREQLFARACGAVADASEIALVVLVDDVIQGFLIYSQVLDEVSIHDVAVHVDSGGQGVGRLLLAQALLHMKSRGAQRCLLEVRESNRAARALYSRLRFREDGVRQNYYPAATGREDAVLMSLQL